LQSSISKRNRHAKHTQSVDSIDYDLSSSDDEKQTKMKDIDDRSDFQITIARDKLALDVSPCKTDVSDAKTSDITKVSHARDIAGIMHEKMASVSTS